MKKVEQLLSILENKINVDNDFLIDLKTIYTSSMKRGSVSQATLIQLIENYNRTNDSLYDIEVIVKVFEFKGVNVEISNVEYDDDESEITEPFDSTKINIPLKTSTFKALITRLSYSEINLKTVFQRKSGIWDEVKMSRFIESLMLKIPIPTFYFDGSDEELWLVIDGLQRLTSIKQFCVDQTMKLSGLEYLIDFNNSTYDDLPRMYQRRIEEADMVAYIIQPGTPDRVKYNIFRRINTGGMTLEPQEIRHALYQGKATKLIEKLGESKEFARVTQYDVPMDRMLNREFGLRFIAFLELGTDNYTEMEGFLNKMMETLNGFDDKKLDSVEVKFFSALKLSEEVFGDKAFRKYYDYESRKNPINKVIYDSWMVNFAKLSDSERVGVLNKKDMIFRRFGTAVRNGDFKLTGGKIKSIKERFDLVERLIKESLDDKKDII